MALYGIAASLLGPLNHARLKLCNLFPRGARGRGRSMNHWATGRSHKRNPEPACTHRRADPRRLDDKSLCPPGPRLWTRIAPSGRGLLILCNRTTLLSAATVKGRDRCIILVVPDIHSNPGAAISTTITTTLDRRPHHRLPPYPHRPVVVLLPALQTSQYLYS